MTAKAARNRSVIGEKWGSLTVTSERAEVGKSSGGKYYRYVVWVVCDCGSVKQVKYEEMRCGKITGCGCRRGTQIGSRGNKSQTKEYRAWAGMIKRCYDPKYKLYHRYGGRGIQVCERWRNSLDFFITDMGKCPEGMSSIDRYPNNDGHYEPGNCRWATDEQQSNNRSTNLNYTINGETKTLKQWSVIHKIKYGTAWGRIKDGWDIQKALTHPIIDSKYKSTAL